MYIIKAEEVVNMGNIKRVKDCGEAEVVNEVYISRIDHFRGLYDIYHGSTLTVFDLFLSCSCGVNCSCMVGSYICGQI